MNNPYYTDNNHKENLWILPFGNPVYDDNEIKAVTKVIENGDLATGKYVEKFEKSFTDYFAYKFSLACSSGSMANLIAVAAMCELKKTKINDRMIVSGATFISAVSPIVQNGLLPVFIDNEYKHCNIDLEAVEASILEHNAVGMLIPHTLGQSLDLEKLKYIKDKYDIFIIEDCCESIGAKFRDDYIGKCGDISTFSFYAGHHISTGEGGMLVTAERDIFNVLKSIRGFGRDFENKSQRFEYNIGDRLIAPEERYIHLRMGYNGKMTDMQAAVGIEQLKKLDEIINKRQEVARVIVAILKKYKEIQILGEPENQNSSPFGIPFYVQNSISRKRLVDILERNKIEVRGLLGASLPHQPCFDNINKIIKEPYENNLDYASKALIIGCPPFVDISSVEIILENALIEWKKSERNEY